MVVEEVGNLTGLAGKVEGLYSFVTAPLPENYQILVTLLFYVLVIIIYSIFIWKFYRFIARRNILRIDLNKYNTTEKPLLSKFIASLFFIIEYIIIVPLLVFFWFGILSLFLLLLSKSRLASDILLISAAVVAGDGDAKARMGE